MDRPAQTIIWGYRTSTVCTRWKENIVSITTQKKNNRMTYTTYIIHDPEMEIVLFFNTLLPDNYILIMIISLPLILICLPPNHAVSVVNKGKGVRDCSR